MSETEKGKIVEMMAGLPPEKQTLAEGIIIGLAAAAKSVEPEPEKEKKKNG